MRWFRRPKPTFSVLRPATPSSEWMAEYNHAWYAHHGDLDAHQKGHWQRGDQTGRDYWITGTPDFDAKWFRLHRMGMPHPWRMVGAVESTWIDFGDGLRLKGVAE